jgi:dipeptidyl aminopeptidase/acylaminoacyl peptidase
MHRSVRTTLRACALAMAALTALTMPAHASAPLVPIKHFFENPAFNGAILSPDATSLAVLVGGGGMRDRLVVIDLVSNKITPVAKFASVDIGEFEWVNNQRLVFNSKDKKTGRGDNHYAPGLWAVNKDASNLRQLVDIASSYSVEHPVARTILPYNHYLTGQKGAQDSDAIYVKSPRYSETTGEFDAMNLVRLDTVTGRAVTVQRPGKSQYWLLDANGEPRLTSTLDKNIETVQYLDPATKQWRKLAAFDTYVGGEGAFTPRGFAPDGSLYVISNATTDTFSLYTFDFKTNKINPTPVLALDGFDFDGHLLTAGDKLLGIRYTSDAGSTVWLDANMKATQAKVDALLPNTVNLIDTASRAALPVVLIDMYSDRQPHKYVLFNTETGKLTGIGGANTDINPAEMGEQEFVRIKTRDGKTVPTWLTLPNGSTRKNLPLVVLVHGGPHIRGAEWGWREEDQFLASRGYAVLQPEFRGSTGYGVSHHEAGWKQWGLAMQNDIADATRWAIAQGIADPKRICIAGASYGGYATLMGLINDPDLYKCGVEWLGVTDLTLMHDGHGSFISDISDNYKQYGFPTLVGDPVKDAARFKATSPLQQAARVTQPLLMAYGAVDQRVPLYHGRKFYEAVKPTNPNVELVIYDEEAHGWELPKTRIDFWTRVEKFLDKQIGVH